MSMTVIGFLVCSFNNLIQKQVFMLISSGIGKKYDEQRAVENPLGSRTLEGKRYDKEWLTLLGVERKLIENLSISLEYLYSSNDSNDDSSAYDGNQISLGIRWEI